MHYEKLDRDSLANITKEVKDAVQSMFSRETIDKNTKDHLILNQPYTAKFYLLPKIHKKNHPGRPIVSLSNTPTERISQFVDHHLKPLVSTLPSYVRDTTDFLKKKKGKYPHYRLTSSSSHWTSHHYTQTSPTWKALQLVKKPSTNVQR